MLATWYRWIVVPLPKEKKIDKNITSWTTDRPKINRRVQIGKEDRQSEPTNIYIYTVLVVVVETLVRKVGSRGRGKEQKKRNNDTSTTTTTNNNNRRHYDNHGAGAVTGTGTGTGTGAGTTGRGNTNSKYKYKCKFKYKYKYK